VQNECPARRVQHTPRMNEQKLDIEKLTQALVARAQDDARTFREKYPDDAPTERWIENSFTAALPLAKDDAGFDPGPGAQPHLFSAYRHEIERQVGERVSRLSLGSDPT
jgi:hypothetical protein